jgi:hypothetical protein
MAFCENKTDYVACLKIAANFLVASIYILNFKVFSYMHSRMRTHTRIPVSKRLNNGN